MPIPVNPQVTNDALVKHTAIMINDNHKQYDLVASFKSQYDSRSNEQIKAFNNVGKEISKNLQLQSLGNKLGNIFNNGFKSFTAPFRHLSASIGNAFSGLKSTLVAPFKGISNKFGTMFGGLKDKLSALKPSNIKNKIANVVKKPKEAVKTLLGQNDEQLKARYYRIWWNPKKVAKIWAKEFAKVKESKTVKKKESGTADLGSVFFNVNKVLRGIALGVSLISKAVAFFFLGPGAGIALAIGIAPLVALLGFIFYTIFEKVSPLIDAIQNTVIPLIQSIGEKLNMFLQNPGQFIREAIEGSITGIVGGVVGGVSNIFSGVGGNEQTGTTDMDVVFKYLGAITRLLKDTNTYIKTDLPSAIHDKFKANVSVNTEEGTAQLSLSSFPSIDSFQKMFNEEFGVLANTFNGAIDKVVNTITGYTEKIEYFHNRLFAGLDEIKSLIAKSTNQTFTDTSKDFATAFVTYVKDSMSLLFGKDERAVKQNVEVGEVNPFAEIISGFEKMNKESIQLLTDIRTSILNIEKSKIKIGNELATNTGTTSDAKKTNNLQNITLNYQVDIDSVIKKMDETNEKLDGILTNTSLTESSDRKIGSVWSI
jgi:hypothetical protein